MQRNNLLVAGIGALVLVGGGLFLGGFLDLVVLLGQNIPQQDVASDYVIGVVWALFLGLSIMFWPVPGQNKLALMRCWAAKCLVTLGFMLFYESHYGLDSFGYFGVSSAGLSTAPPFVFGNGTANMFWLSYMHDQILPHSYHMMKVSFSLVGFVALYLFYRAATRYLQMENERLLYALILLPSNLFWSSVLGKDPIVLLGIALFTYGVVAWSRNYRFHYIIVAGIGVLLAASFRVWLGPILLAPTCIFALKRMRGLLTKALFLSAMGVGFFFALGHFTAQFNLETSQDVTNRTSAISQSWATGGGGQLIEGGLSSPIKIITFMPLGVVTALFRPLPGEILNPSACWRASKMRSYCGCFGALSSAPACMTLPIPCCYGPSCS